VIVDLERFIEAERKSWDELEAMLRALEGDAAAQMTLDQCLRLHYLYQRASADLARVSGFASEAGIRSYLESLVARAYGQVHDARPRDPRFSFWRLVSVQFPCTFRRYWREFCLALAITVVGAVFGSFAVSFEPEAREALMPFRGLLESPKQRVAREESARIDPLANRKGTFSAELMTHNIQVAVFTMGLGATWGIGPSSRCSITA
jgi:hypothetical protein